MRCLRPSFRISRSIAYSFRTLHYEAPKLFSNGDVGPMASILRSRAVVRFRGPETLKFLQSLLTNDVRRFGEPAAVSTTNMSAVAPPMYAALLTPHGRFLYEVFVYRPPQAGEKLERAGSGPGSDPDGSFELLMDVDSSNLEEFVETFKRYRLRSKVEIENVTGEFSCWQRYGGELSKKLPPAQEPDGATIGLASGVGQSGVSALQGTNLGWQWFRDPRLACLGFRGIFPSSTTPPLFEADKKTDEQKYLQWRLEHGVAEGSTEIPKGEAVPLEYNFAGLNAISFDKGCYVGQELVARTHHRGVIRKRLLPLKFCDNSGKEVEEKVAPGSEVINTTSGKKAGTVTTALGCRGLGRLRLDDAFKGAGTLAIQGREDVKVEAIRPEWWPSEWFQQHQEHRAVA